MTVAPLIAMKSSQVRSFDAVGRELDRRAHTYENDLDGSGRHIGYVCRAGDEHPLPLERAVERRMGELKTKRKIRDNQVRAMGFIVSSNDALDEKTAREFLDRSINWFGARYGYENLLAAQIHLDEGTPHAHIWVAPVIHDAETGFDRLCAKELFAPDKRRKNAEGKWEVTAQGTMSRLQEDFWEQVARPYGYERPMRHERRAEGYRSLEAYKVQVGTTRALKSEIEALEGARDKAKRGAMTAKRELAQKAEERDGIQVQIDQCKAHQAEEGAKLGALRAEVKEKQGLAADLSAQIEKKAAEKVRISDQIADFSQKAESAAQRLESVQGELGEVESIAQAGLPELAKRAASAGDGERESAARSQNQALRARLAALEEEGDGLAGRVRSLEGEKRGLEDENRGLRGRLEGFERRLDDLWARLVDAAETVRDYVFEQVGCLKWVFDGLGLTAYEGMAPLADRGYDLASESRDMWAASEELEREGWHEEPPRSRGFSR